MNEALLRLYHALPAPAWTLAASLRGWQLERWRYGGDTEARVEAALERETWSAERWRHYREERLAFVLHRAVTRVPFYREAWAERRRRGDRAAWDVLAHWPVLEKAALRQSPRAFLADDVDPRRMFHEQTSGTSGQPLELWWSRATVRQWYALLEARWRRWYGVARGDRWAILGGQLVVPAARRRPPFWVWNAPMRQLYLSAYHLAPDLLPHTLDALARYRVRYLWGYSSALHTLALGMLAGGRRDLEIAVVITNAEPLLPHQRETIAAAFGCPVRETYGMAEIAAAASECAEGRLHLWPEVGIVELADEAAEDGGRSGELVVTGLLNADMPLVRYRLGDRLTLPLTETEAACACGRTLPRLLAVDGRSDDVLWTRDGRAVGRLDPVFKARLPILEAQIVQETLDRVRLRYRPAPGFTAATGAELSRRLRDRLGDVEVVLEEVASLPRTRRGKLRAVVCELPPDARPHKGEVPP